MSKPNVIVTRRLLPHLIQQIMDACNVQYWDKDEPIPRKTLLEWLGSGNVDGLYCLLTDKIDEELLAHVDEAVERAGGSGRRLRVVSTMSVGFDHIDVAACTKRGIVVGNTPGVLTDTTADLAMALMLATSRRLAEGVECVKAGLWPPWSPMWMTGQDVSGKTVGIVGLGRIGFAVACRLVGFSCHVMYHDTERKPELEKRFNQFADAIGTPHLKFVSFDALLEQSDIVSAHTVLSEETSGMFGAAQFAQMKPTSVFVNTSRGGIVDQDALLNALDNAESGPWAAGLDVVLPEPIPRDHPLVIHARCVVLPHIGSGSVETRTKMEAMAVDNLMGGVMGGTLPNGVNV